jgi:hypothetical protein
MFLCQIICWLRFGTAPAAEESEKSVCSSAAFPEVFTFREAGTQVSSVTMSRPSLGTIAPPPCLPLGLKDLLKEDERLFDKGRIAEVVFG